MTVDSKRQVQKVIKERKYLNKDFDGFKADFEEYARTYFPDKIKDLTSNGFGGLLLELCASVGDVQSFYLEHQFNELSPETAVEAKNIETLLKDSGVKIVGASPSTLSSTFFVKIPSSTSSGAPAPDRTAMPVLHAGSILQADNGVYFELVEDIDFSALDYNGNLKATVVVGDIDINNDPLNFILSLDGLCVSGQRISESFSVNGFEQFKRITLSKKDVTQIISVVDSNGNTYHEVDYLTQDTVYRGVLNKGIDNDLVKDNLEITPAPYRFTSSMAIDTRLSTLTFGGGSAESMDDDIVPDPSELALPLYGKSTFGRFTLNPGNLLRTSTLGVISPNSTLTVVYRYGGGLNHNIPENTIKGLSTVLVTFPGNPSAAVAAQVRETLDATNVKEAGGGDDAPTLDELKLRIPGERAAQARIVSKEDLLARVYSLPANFGRVFRAAARSNPNNPNSTQFFLLCKNSQRNLAVAPDALKKNLMRYLNSLRLISDSIDILDAQVINLKLEYTVVVAPDHNRQLVIQNINNKLKKYFNIKNFEIDQPLVVSDVENIIFNNQGVVSVQRVRVTNITGQVGSNVYSDAQFDVTSNTFKGKIILPPSGGIFEIKYPDNDIVGSAI